MLIQSWKKILDANLYFTSRNEKRIKEIMRIYTGNTIGQHN